MNDRARYVARVAYETADEAFCRWPLGVSRRCEIEIFEETKVQKVQWRRTSTNCSKYKKKNLINTREEEKKIWYQPEVCIIFITSHTWVIKILFIKQLY